MLLATLMAAAALTAPAPAPVDPPARVAGHSRVCGSVSLYGHRLRLRERGELIPCKAVRRVTSPQCDLLKRRRWTCFSQPPPHPLLSWVRTDELFRPEVSTVIEAVRYPCSDAEVTAALWAAARIEPGSTKYPTRLQVMADDMYRCNLLKGETGEDVLALLGPPSERSRSKGITYLDYMIGPERDSVFVIDPEYFSVEIGRDGVFRRAAFYQG